MQEMVLSELAADSLQGADRQLDYRGRYASSERRCARLKGCLVGLSLMEPRTSMQAECDDEEVVRLREINRCLRTGVPMELPPWDKAPIVRDTREADLIAARAEAQMLDAELARMSNQRFEDDERLRGYESIRARLPGDDVGMYPVLDCGSDACRAHTRRLRAGMRQVNADAFLRERRVRINGHFRLNVVPLERLRAEKDLELAKMRRRIKQLECAAFLTAEQAQDMAAINDSWVAKAAEVERLTSEAEDLEEANEGLRTARDGLEAQVEALRYEHLEALRTIEASQERCTLDRAERSQLETEREHVQNIWDRINAFMTGPMATEYNAKRLELERLERAIEALKPTEPVPDAPEDEPHPEPDPKRPKGGI